MPKLGFVVLVLFGAGCAVAPSVLPPLQREAPVSVEVIEEVYDGERLYLELLVQAKRPVRPEFVEIRVVPLNDSFSDVEYQPLTGLYDADSGDPWAAEQIEAGESVRLLWTEVMPNIERYAFEVRWDLEKELESKAPEVLFKATSESSIEFLECSPERCLVSFVLEGRLENRSESLIQRAVLEIALRDGEGVLMEESVRQIPLANLSLSPGERQFVRFRYRENLALSEESGSRLRPVAWIRGVNGN